MLIFENAWNEMREKIKIKSILTRFVAVIVVFDMVIPSFFSVDFAIASERQQSLGMGPSELKAAGYSSMGGSCVRDVEAKSVCELQTSQWCVLLKDRTYKSCIYRLQARGDINEQGNSLYRTVDALELMPARGEKFLDDDTNCVSGPHKDSNIVAVGFWRWRAKPKIGGYAYGISHAWTVDLKLKKFIEIPVSGVRCEINDDRD